jgi:hypothetical protein
MSCAFRRSLTSMACITHAATHLGNVSGRNLATQGYRMDYFKYGDVFNHAQFVEAYNSLSHPANAGEQANGMSPQAGDQAAQPRRRAVAGELQALQNLRLGDAAKPRPPRPAQKNPAEGGTSRPGAKTKQPEAPFEERVQQDFERWLTGGAPTAQRADAAARIEYAELEQEHALTLDGLSLGRIPAKVGQFAQLRALRIGGNQLDHLPSAVTRLKQLQTLDARDNRMTELPSNIGRLPSLRHLNVDSNRLESLPHELADLAQLEALSARSNRLRLVPPRMGALKNLRELDLAQNQLGDIPGTWGPLFGLLGRLDLSHNQLQQLPSTCEIPVRKLNLNVSENASMASLPTVFGGFGYAAKLRLTAADDHQLKNAGGRVKVNTRGTNIRQGLVNEARLAAGRGIEKGRAVPGRHRPRLVPLEGSDWNSTSSELSFMRDHEEAGEIEGLQHVGQGAEADETWGERRLQAWAEGLAEQYASRHFPAQTSTPALAPQQEPEPDLWTAARVDMFDIEGAGGAPSVLPSPPPAPQRRSDLLTALHAELERLPQPQASAVAAYLSSVPQHRLAFALAQLRNGPGGRMQGDMAGTMPMPGAAAATARLNDAAAPWFEVQQPFGPV